MGTSMGTMGTLAIEFEWPFEVENGKWLLYLTEIVMDGTSETHCFPPGDVVNPLKLNVNENTHAQMRKRMHAPLTCTVKTFASNVLKRNSHKHTYPHCKHYHIHISIHTHKYTHTQTNTNTDTVKTYNYAIYLNNK